MNDIRWKQRFANYLKAFRALQSAVGEAKKRDLSDLEKQGLIQSFEFTHELSWNLMKDYLTEEGISNITGSKGATRAAFQNGLVADGDTWMKMIEDRNLTTHTYDENTAGAIAGRIIQKYFAAFDALTRTFTELHDKNNT